MGLTSNQERQYNKDNYIAKNVNGSSALRHDHEHETKRESYLKIASDCPLKRHPLNIKSSKMKTKKNVTLEIIEQYSVENTKQKQIKKSFISLKKSSLVFKSVQSPSFL